MWQWINGKKTYILAGVTIVALWSQVWAGTVSTSDAIDGTLAAIGAGTLRHAIEKNGPIKPPA